MMTNLPVGAVFGGLDDQGTFAGVVVVDVSVDYAQGILPGAIGEAQVQFMNGVTHLE